MLPSTCTITCQCWGRTLRYVVYGRYNDIKIMSEITELYRLLYPSLDQVMVMTPKATTDDRIKAGFASHYFRAHSICKLLRGMIRNLDRTKISRHTLLLHQNRRRVDGLCCRMRRRLCSSPGGFAGEEPSSRDDGRRPRIPGRRDECRFHCLGKQEDGTRPNLLFGSPGHDRFAVTTS